MLVIPGRYLLVIRRLFVWSGRRRPCGRQLRIKGLEELGMRAWHFSTTGGKRFYKHGILVMDPFIESLNMQVPVPVLSQCS